MFNFSGSEMVFLLLLALIVLGPEKLPDAIRKFAKTYGEFKKMTTGFQDELKTVLDEPMREMRETADAFKRAATFDVDLDPKTAAAPDVKTAADATPAPPSPDPALDTAPEPAPEAGPDTAPDPAPEAAAVAGPSAPGNAPPLAPAGDDDRGAAPA